MSRIEREVLERSQAIERFTAEKVRWIKALLYLYQQDPTLPIEDMVRECSTALDAVAGFDLSARGPVMGCLDFRPQRGRADRPETRAKLVQAAVELIMAGDNRGNILVRAAHRAGVGEATGYAYFRKKEELLWAAYDHLVRQILNPPRH